MELETEAEIDVELARGLLPDSLFSSLRALSRVEDAISLPGSSHSLIFAFRTDNSGPPMPDEVSDGK